MSKKQLLEERARMLELSGYDKKIIQEMQAYGKEDEMDEEMGLEDLEDAPGEQELPPAPPALEASSEGSDVEDKIKKFISAGLEEIGMEVEFQDDEGESDDLDLDLDDDELSPPPAEDEFGGEQEELMENLLGRVRKHINATKSNKREEILEEIAKRVAKRLRK